jgi:hypothetical protein
MGKADGRIEGKVLFAPSEVLRISGQNLFVSISVHSCLFVVKDPNRPSHSWLAPVLGWLNSVAITHLPVVRLCPFHTRRSSKPERDVLNVGKSFFAIAYRRDALIRSFFGKGKSSCFISFGTSLLA